MTWFDSASNQAAAIAPHVEVVTFVSLDFGTGTVVLHTRTGTIEWGGYYWLGIGQLGSIDTIKEDTQVRPNGLRLTISGVDTALVQSAITEDYHGRPVAIYIGLLDTATNALIDTPEVAFKGVMDFLTVELNQNTGSISVNCESEMARWQRPRGLLYTHESQQLLYEGDRGFDMIPAIQNRVLDWTKRTLMGWNAAQRIARSEVRK